MACCTTLATIEKACGGGNATGLRTKLYVACLEHVSAIPAADVDTHTISTDITMVADIGDTTPGVWFEWNISKVNANYSAERTGEGENVEYNHTLTVFMNKMDATKHHVLNGSIGSELLVVFTDRNGFPQLMGNLLEGATMVPVPQTEGTNGYAVTFTWTSNELLYHYTGATPTA